MNFTPFPVSISTKAPLEEIKRGYYRFASRETALCRDEPWMSWLVFQGMKSFVNVAEGNAYEYYVHEKTFLSVMRKIADIILEPKGKHFQTYDARKERLLDCAAQLGKNKDNKKWSGLYGSFLDAAYDFCEYIWGAWGVIHCIEPEVMRAFPEKVGLVMALEQPIEFMKMQKALYDMPKMKMLEEFSWLNVYSPYDAPYMEHDFERMKKEIIEDEVKARHNQFARVRGEFARFANSISNQTMRKKVEVVHKYAFLKTDRIDAWKKAMWLIAPFFDYVATLAPGYTLKDATNLSISEVFSLLADGKAPDVTHVRARSRNEVLYYVRAERISIIEKHDEVLHAKKALQGEIKEVVEMKGIVACAGRVVGRVRVIKHSSDCERVKKGDIFVAKYTFPSFTPFMKKCAGIVTDEGGITSHAAIVSREYGIPCVIAAKNATRVFKDGDRVEVDANKGIVRRIG